MRFSAATLKRLVRQVIKEEIRKVKGGYKVYPKKPRKGKNRREAFSKKPMSYKKALRQLRAIERSKAMSEDTLSELEQLHMYKKYDLGIDNVEDKTKGHENIIGHT
jgi:hypothetical protein